MFLLFGQVKFNYSFKLEKNVSLLAFKIKHVVCIRREIVLLIQGIEIILWSRDSKFHDFMSYMNYFMNYIIWNMSYILYIEK